MNRKDIGRRIETYREKAGMSTQELAERIGRSQATISRVENGLQGLTFELLDSIATELHIHPFALLSDAMPRYPLFRTASEGEDDAEEEITGGPTLLAHALYCGRLHRRLGLKEAANLLNLEENTLKAIETGARAPGKGLLERLCTLYGLPLQVTKLAMDFDCVAPDTAQGLARMQHVLSRALRIARRAEPGQERQALSRIVDMLDSVEKKHLPDWEYSSAEFDFLVNRIAHHLTSDLKDAQFRDNLVKLGRNRNHK